MNFQDLKKTDFQYSTVSRKLPNPIQNQEKVFVLNLCQTQSTNNPQQSQSSKNIPATEGRNGRGRDTIGRKTMIKNTRPFFSIAVSTPDTAMWKKWPEI